MLKELIRSDKPIDFGYLAFLDFKNKRPDDTIVQESGKN